MANSHSSESEIIQKFIQCYERPTLKKMQEITGINYVRLFRLINGYSMSHEEYCVLQTAINLKNVGVLPIVDLAVQCEAILTPRVINQIGESMNRSLKLARYLNMNTKVEKKEVV